MNKRYERIDQVPPETLQMYILNNTGHVHSGPNIGFLCLCAVKNDDGSKVLPGMFEITIPPYVLADLVVFATECPENPTYKEEYEEAVKEAQIKRVRKTN